MEHQVKATKVVTEPAVVVQELRQAVVVEQVQLAQMQHQLFLAQVVLV
jgi:hypothetical protein